jgi:Fe-S cluster assembly protein SufD
MIAASESGAFAPSAADFSHRARFSSEAIERVRERAFERFAEGGWPHARDEAWKHTPVSSILATAFQPVDGGEPSPIAAGALAELGITRNLAPRLVIANGRFAPELSDLSGDVGGLRITSLRDAIADEPDAIALAFARSLPAENSFTLLNTAYLSDGAVITIPEGVFFRNPIHVLYVASAAGPPLALFPRNIIRVGRNARASIVLTYVGSGISLTTAVTQVAVEENASLDLVTLQRQGPEAVHLSLVGVDLARASRFSTHLFSVGASIARDDLHAVLSGEGAECTLNGLFLEEAAQRADLQTVVDHAVPHGTSRQVYKGILDGRSRGAFTGKVIVRPGAQKTDAQQTNKNLLLSREALVDSTPALEIRANDVKCKHGSTTGQLDADALFYLRSRGLSDESARNLLTYAFASDLVQRVPDGPVRHDVDRALHARLPQAPAIDEIAGTKLGEIAS